MSPQCQQHLRQLPACWQNGRSGFRHPICTVWKEGEGWLFHRPSQESRVVSFPEFPELPSCFSLVPTESSVNSLPSLCGRETPHAHWVPGSVTMMGEGEWIEYMAHQREVDTHPSGRRGSAITEGRS